MADVLFYMAGQVALLAGAVAAVAALVRSQPKMVPDVLLYVRDFHRLPEVVAEGALVELLVAFRRFVQYVNTREVPLQFAVSDHLRFKRSSILLLRGS